MLLSKFNVIGQFGRDAPDLIGLPGEVLLLGGTVGKSRSRATSLMLIGIVSKETRLDEVADSLLE